MAALRSLLNAKELTGSLYPRALPEESRQMVKAKMEAMGYPLSPPAVPTKEPSNNDGQNLRPTKYSSNKDDKAGATSYDDYDRSIYTSIYEERLSRDMTPAGSNNLNHNANGPLPYRPARGNSESQANPSSNKRALYKERRRSRSISGDRNENKNPWDGYNSSQLRTVGRRDSGGRSSSQPPVSKEHNGAGAGSMQTLHDRHAHHSPRT